MSDGLSAAVRSNLSALQQLASDIGRVQTRLATGRKVNSPVEGPAAYFTASALNARVTALNAMLDDIGTSRTVLEAAGAGIKSMQSLIDNGRELAYQALNSTSTLAKVSGSVTSLSNASAISMDDGDTITVSDGTTTATYVHAAGQDVQDFLDAVNDTANLKVEASLTTDGRIKLEATGVNNLVIGGTASGAELSALGLSAGTTTSTTNTLRQSLAQQFDSIRDQIDALASDADVNGQNLLGGASLSFTLNETGSSTVNVAGTLVTASSLGIDAASGAGGDFQSDSDINSFIADLDAATDSLEQMASRYGTQSAVVSVREDFSRQMSNLLTTGADSLVNADMDTDSALMLALQTRRSLAVTALSLAADADGTALRLFGTR